MLPEKILKNKHSTKVELDKCEAHQGGNRMPERVYAEAEESGSGRNKTGCEQKEKYDMIIHIDVRPVCSCSAF